MAATLELVIRGRDEFSGTLGKAQSSFASLAKTGAALGLGFTSVEGALEGAKRVLISSIGSAAAYEGQMAKLRALTGATKGDTDKLTDSIIDMTKRLPKSPAELGAGAYFILSSGITDVADATEVLEIAAKASTVGLGETQVVADALTTVLNAYGKEASEAGQVTDVLMQAVKDGKAEASEFSMVLGRVVPIAAQMGISFEEVAANMATFTRLGVGADEAATGLRGAMSALLNPSAQAKDLLAGVGLTIGEVQKAIRENGFAATLQDLIKQFQGNSEALGILFPEVRGLTAVLATAGSQGDVYKDILGNMNTATGNLERGFADVSDTAQIKMQQAMNNLNVALMELGTEALPAVATGATEAAEAIRGTREAVDDAGESSGFDQLHEGSERLKKDYGIDLPAALKDGFVESLKITKDTILDTLPVMSQFRDALDIKGDIEGVGRALGVFGGSADEAKSKVSDYGLTIQQTQILQQDLAASGEDLAGVVGTVGDAASTAGGDVKDDLTPGLEGAIDTMGEMQAAADETRKRLFAMFKEPTQEEEIAEAALAEMRLELAALEEQSGGSKDAETDRARQLRDELIPAQDRHLDVLRLTRDAAKEEADVKFAGASSQEVWRQRLDEASGSLTTQQQKLLEVALSGAPSFTGAVDSATGAAGRFRDTLYSIPTEIKTRLDFDIIRSLIGEGAVGGVGLHAHGGTVKTPFQIVGEQGPELAALPMGTRIFPAHETAQMLSSHTSTVENRQQNVTVNIDGPLVQVNGADLENMSMAATERLGKRLVGTIRRELNHR